jgi:hypothetical protein
LRKIQKKEKKTNFFFENLKSRKIRKTIKFIATFNPIAKLIQLGIQMAIVAFLQKPRERLRQGQSVGYLKGAC